MRVVVVSPYDLTAPGGVQQVCTELVTRLRAAGEDAVLVGPGAGSGASARIRRVPANRSTVPLTLDRDAVRAVRRQASEADVIHIHEPFIPLVGWAVTAAADRPRVATFHADPAAWSRTAYRLGARLGRRLLAGAELTAVSPVAATALPESWGPVTIVPNAIDVAAYRVDVERHPHRVVFLGRDDRRKGLDVALAAWPAVRRSVPDAELIVVGARRTGRWSGVEFRGRVDEEDKRRGLASASIHIAPNRGGESFGVVVAEGMAAGCAVVASDIPAFAHVLGSDGVLVPRDDATALAREVVDLLCDPTRCRRLGAAARKAVTRFDWSAVVDHYLGVYESALRRHRSTMERRKE